MAPPTPAIEILGISKHFGEVHALRDVSLTIGAGESYAICGENGAGKSTLVRILGGLVRPSAGTLAIDGVAFSPKNPAQALARGIGVVHQHFMLVSTATALDNTLLGVEPTGRFGILDRTSARLRFVETARRYSLDVAPDQKVEEMSVGQKQRLEILKILLLGCRHILLDEPTAVLTPQESKSLFVTLQELRAQGVTLVLVTHRLQEILDHATRVTVLRDGAVVTTTHCSETSTRELARHLVGREPAEIHVASHVERGEGLLRLRKTRDRVRRGAPIRLDGIDLEVHAGEIVGIAGVEGNGQRELAETLAGVRPYDGEAALFGREIRKETPASLRRRGLAHIPGDRTVEGILPDMTVTENLLLGRQHSREFLSHGYYNRGRVQSFAAERIAAFDVRPAKSGVPIRALSGGNQQKVVFARESYGEPRLLLAVHPTRGVDVAAQEIIHRALLEHRSRGAGILLISSDLTELIHLCDRIEVLVRGTLSAKFDRGEANEEILGLAMTGGTS